ncbi:MAG: hypothetical protein JNJ70_18970 [Verrucomicrobiales bacterium]|nr:hypothetical protein [Verrucomicrobiales bacterium]
MKTTIELPDEIFRRVKLLAAERRTTLKDVVTEALGHFLDSSGEKAAKTRKAHLKRLLTEMQASNTEPMVPLVREEAHER